MEPHIQELKEAAERAEQEENAANSHLQRCRAAKRHAMEVYNTAKMVEMGIVPGETIVVIPDRSWSHRTTSIEVVVMRGSVNSVDCAVGRQVTSKRKVWGRRHMREIAFDRIIEITDKVLAKEGGA